MLHHVQYLFYMFRLYFRFTSSSMESQNVRFVVKLQANRMGGIPLDISTGGIDSPEVVDPQQLLAHMRTDLHV